MLFRSILSIANIFAMESMLDGAINYAIYGLPNVWDEQGYLLNEALGNMYSEGTVWNNGNSSVTIAGYGSTGRTTANNMYEVGAMIQVLSDPLKGAKDLSTIKNPIIMNDSKHGWLASDGWVKMARNVDGVEIHFLYNTITGVFDDFKFK